MHVVNYEGEREDSRQIQIGQPALQDTGQGKKLTRYNEAQTQGYKNCAGQTIKPQASLRMF